MDSGWAQVWIDGEILPLAEARVPVTDRGFLFADSVFETVRTYGRAPFLLGDHLDRLRRSAAALKIDLPHPDDRLESVVSELLCSCPKGEEATLRIVLTRGCGGSGLGLPDPTAPRMLILCRPLLALPLSAHQDGVSIGIPEQSTIKSTSALAGVKSGSYVASVLALAEVQARGHREALLRAQDGQWSEATTSNLFLVRNGQLITPRLQDDILPGVTRAVVLAACRKAGLAVEKRAVLDEDLKRAEELFLTSSIKEILPVVRVEDREVGDGRPGPLTRRVQDLFVDAVAEIWRRDCGRWREAFPD